MRRISGLPILRALAPRPRCGAAARRAIPSRSCPPFPRPRLCRCGSPAVGAGLALSAAGHRPAQALASLPPSVAAPPPARAPARAGQARAARARRSSPPRARPSGSRSTRPALSGAPQAAAGPPAPVGGCLSGVVRPALRYGHTTPMAFAAHPRQAQPVTVTSALRKATPPTHPRQAERVTAARPVGSQMREALRASRPFFPGPILG